MHGFEKQTGKRCSQFQAMPALPRAASGFFQLEVDAIEPALNSLEAVRTATTTSTYIHTGVAFTHSGKVQ